MWVWDSSGSPLLCPISCVNSRGKLRSQAALASEAPCQRVLCWAKAAAPRPGRPAGCQQEPAEVVVMGEVESGVSGTASKASKKGA